MITFLFRLQLVLKGLHASYGIIKMLHCRMLASIPSMPAAVAGTLELLLSDREGQNKTCILAGIKGSS